MISVKGPNSGVREEEMDEFREELRLRERELQRFGFERNRGLETYSIKEIKELAKRNNYSENFFRALQKCLNKHVEFYLKLHGLKEFRPIKENESMENILKIRRWLTSPAKEMPKKPSKSEILIKHFFEELERAENFDYFKDWYEKVLRKTFRRDYDVYRFIEFLTKAYNEYIGFQALVPDFSDVGKSSEEILQVVTKKKIEDRGFIVFLARRINQEYPNLIKTEKCKNI